MKFTQQRAEGVNLIRRYGADYVTIGEEDIRASCLVSATRIERNWAPKGVADLASTDLATLLSFEPEVIVLSTGTRPHFPPAAWRAEFATRKIGLEVMGIGAACRTYNVLVAEERRALAAILLPG